MKCDIGTSVNTDNVTGAETQTAAIREQEGSADASAQSCTATATRGGGAGEGRDGGGSFRDRMLTDTQHDRSCVLCTILGCVTVAVRGGVNRVIIQ